MPYLFDTHTHFDVPEYDSRREIFNADAYAVGVTDLVLIGYQATHFDRMVNVKMQADSHYLIRHHLAFGLHPLYIAKHHDDDLDILEDYIRHHPSIAIAEIGLDTYPSALKSPDMYDKQVHFFTVQIALSKMYDLPILLHIRKSHAATLQILKMHKYNAHERGGIAHSFSGGMNEALAFAKLGFKIGITGQITNPNAKKLRQAVMAVFARYGVDAFVLETDCPDMTPLPAQITGSYFNEPKNLPYVLDKLVQLFDMDKDALAQQLWHNTMTALHLDLPYPHF